MGYVYVGIFYAHVHEHGHGMVLQDSGNRSGKSRRHGNHLVSTLDSPIPQLMGGKGTEGQQVSGGARIAERAIGYAQPLGQSHLETMRPRACRQPKVKRCIHQVDHLPVIKITSAVVHFRFSRHKVLRLGVHLLIIFTGKPQYLFLQLFFLAHTSNAYTSCKDRNLSPHCQDYGENFPSPPSFSRLPDGFPSKIAIFAKDIP